jgi:periplasmic divalent cation tolerance protein
MKLFYVTLNNDAEAKAISTDLIENHIAVCTNWFPINCMYRWEGELVQEAELVMIIKSVEGKRKDIETTIAKHIDYLNCIAEIDVNTINEKYGTWVTSFVK